MREPEEQQSFADAKRRARMARVDALPEDVRPLVHEYGLCLVVAFLEVGVSKPKHIRHLIETVLNELSPTRGSYSAQGVRAPWIDRQPER